MNVKEIITLAGEVKKESFNVRKQIDSFGVNENINDLYIEPYLNEVVGKITTKTKVIMIEENNL